MSHQASNEEASQITKHEVHCYHHKVHSKKHTYTVIQNQEKYSKWVVGWLFYTRMVFFRRQQGDRQIQASQILKFRYKTIVYELLILNCIGFFSAKAQFLNQIRWCFHKRYYDACQILKIW